MLVDDVDENGLGRLLAVIGVRRAVAPPRQRRVGGRKQYLGALVIILLALNARGNLLRFTSVVENNSFPSPRTSTVIRSKDASILTLSTPK